MSVYEVKAARRRLPIVGVDDSGQRTVHRLTASIVSSPWTLPAGYPGNFVRIVAINCDMQGGFYSGSQAPTLVFNLTGSGTGGNSPASGSYSNGMTFFNGLPEEGIVPTRAKRLWVSSSYNTRPEESLPVAGFVYICSTNSGSIELTFTEDMG